FYQYESSIKTYLKAALASSCSGPMYMQRLKVLKMPCFRKFLELDNPLVRQKEASAIESNN
ncbi:peptidase S41, partial [Winogradskyella maritima]|nr:peptidase S41 [Winogradskyella maritima]